MRLFVDTSALLALLDADNQDHIRARQVWEQLTRDGAALVSTNYVLLETFALVQKRLGLEAVRVLDKDLVPLLHIEWIDKSTHTIALAALLAAGRSGLSLVDCASFAVMRRLGLDDVFAFDHDFARQGFCCRP